MSQVELVDYILMRQVAMHIHLPYSILDSYIFREVLCKF